MPKKNTAASGTDLTIQSLTLLARNGSVGVRELSRELSVSASTALRLLRTLAEHDFVHYSESSRTYSIGANFLKLAAQVYRGFSLTYIARPILENLFSRVNETVNLGILTKDLAHVIHVDKIITNRVIRIDTEIGEEAPSYCTGLGKAILAFKPKDEVKDMLNQVPIRPFTRKTITNLDSMLEELGTTKLRGYALDCEEYSEHLECMAAPIFNGRGEAVAALSISTLALNQHVIDDTFSEHLLKAARDITAQLKSMPDLEF